MTARRWLPAALSAALLGWAGAAMPGAAEAQTLLRSQTEGTVNAIQDQSRQAVQPRHEGEVTYTSGGVGSEGIAAMRAVESNYNLRLLFAVQGSGEYLAGVHVRLVDQRGNTVIDTVAEGPYFFAKVKPGRYQVIAESEGKALTRSVDVSRSGAVSRALYWPYAG
ncbi:MAG: carboxypeptidase regulatory-like domain-containing protein [Alphaproteobacteria bacterium]